MDPALVSLHERLQTKRRKKPFSPQVTFGCGGFITAAETELEQSLNKSFHSLTQTSKQKSLKVSLSLDRMS